MMTVFQLIASKIVQVCIVKDNDGIDIVSIHTKLGVTIGKDGLEELMYTKDEVWQGITLAMA